MLTGRDLLRRGRLEYRVEAGLARGRDGVGPAKIARLVEGPLRPLFQRQYLDPKSRRARVDGFGPDQFLHDPAGQLARADPAPHGAVGEVLALQQPVESLLQLEEGVALAAHGLDRSGGRAALQDRCVLVPASRDPLRHGSDLMYRFLLLALLAPPVLPHLPDAPGHGGDRAGGRKPLR